MSNFGFDKFNNFANIINKGASIFDDINGITNNFLTDNNLFSSARDIFNTMSGNKNQGLNASSSLQTRNSYDVDNLIAYINKSQLTRSNKYSVELGLPQGITGFTNDDLLTLSILCDITNLPGRNINTFDYSPTMKAIKMPYGYSTDDVTMTFYVTNNMLAKKLFDAWQALIIDYDGRKLNYKNKYVQDIVIKMLPYTNDTSNPLIGIKLLNAYPVTVNSINLQNDSTEFTKIEVTFAYDDWVDMDISYRAQIASFSFGNNNSLLGNNNGVGGVFGSIINSMGHLGNIANTLGFSELSNNINLISNNVNQVGGIYNNFVNSNIGGVISGIRGLI